MPPAPFPPIDLEKEKAPLPSLSGHSKTILFISLVNLFEGLVPVTIGKACDEYGVKSISLKLAQWLSFSGPVDRAVVDENVEWSLKEKAGPFLHDVAPIPLKSKPPSIRTSGTPYHVMEMDLSVNIISLWDGILTKLSKANILGDPLPEWRKVEAVSRGGRWWAHFLRGAQLLVPLHVGIHVI
ncbi:hypothetical protein OIU85_027747 [Salix viminalis]|uniref:Uncharacterized protein n=1 Tax=Salix viminalis TaxID=40686 RepID=A0A9Q0QJF3_SALVM|nr:hypothetical protein OIU85_027747 [Salix viminalis]